MAISNKEVQYIARLARIELTEKEVKKFQKQLSSILDFVDQLKEVDVDKIEKERRKPNKNILRKDQVVPPEKEDQLVDQAPDYQDGHFKVKNVLK